MIYILAAFLFLSPPSIQEIKDDGIIHTLQDAEKAFKDIGADVEVLTYEHLEAKMHEKANGSNKAKVEFTETKFVVTGDKDLGIDDYHYSILMPNIPLDGNYVMISKPAEITGDTVLLACELLRSL